MTTKTRIAGITAMLCICALIAVPVSAALTTGQGAGAGPMKGHGGNGPGTGLLDALAEQGYDTTALQALLDTAKTAHESGDTEAAQAAMEEFREAVKTAVEETGIQVGPMNGEGHGQHRAGMGPGERQNRMESA
jgi:Spy/CpxP family protein refolding chaperone